MHPPDNLYGFDFGADSDDAGNKIWIAKGNVEVVKGRHKGSRHFWLSMFAEKDQKTVDTKKISD